jgi:predicted outer membrane repeat protein
VQPGAPPPDPVNPATLAQIALSQLNLKAIDIGIVPEADADHTGLVGLPVWMWVENPGPTTFGPNSATASGGGISVTATAQVDRIVWDMGDGTTVTCTTPGTPYADSYGDRSSPDCGHRYERTSVSKPGGVYEVTATSYWTVTWAGGGATGTIPLQLSNNAQIRVGELQVIVTN